MNLLKSLELPELFVFLLPGVVMVYIYQLTVVGTRWEYSRLLLNCLVTATVYSIFAFPIFYIDGGIVLPVYLHNSLKLIVLPILLGVLVAYIKKWDFLRKCFAILGVKLTHPIDTAWDYTFYETLGNGRYCIVSLKNGTKVYGYLGPASFIGSGRDENDLLLENMYQFSDGSWIPLEEPRSVYINGSDILTVELLYVVESSESEVESGE